MYSHSLYDPETDEWIEIHEEDDGLRNARGDRVSPARRRPVRVGRGGRPGRGRPGRVGGRPVRVLPTPRPAPIQPYDGGGVRGVDDDGIRLEKAALVEVIPAIGAVWASFLGRPEPPQAVGDDVVDRNNAASHRDALAQHQQNQTRILALTELAERAVKLFVR